MISNNSLAFIALCNEFCASLENCVTADPREFMADMLRVLPRIYISASDIPADESADGYVESALDEDTYDSIRRNISVLFGENDTYLEVFEEDMKYSETPIAAHISENLSDLFQVFYNFLETVKDAPEEVIGEALRSVRDDFGEYWSRILCNVLRALNAVYYNSNFDE